MGQSQNLIPSLDGLIDWGIGVRSHEGCDVKPKGFIRTEKRVGWVLAASELD